MKTSLLRAPSSTSLLGHLIESPTLVRDVRALPPLTFSKLIQRVGVEDAGELVALATTEQLVSAFDEDLFRNTRPGQREAFDPARFVTWLEVLLEAGEDVAARRFAELLGGLRHPRHRQPGAGARLGGAAQQHGRGR